MEEKLVSVILPTYKGGAVIERAVNSVLRQTYSNIEIIVVDDNNPVSEDRIETERAMAQYQNNQKIIYIRHEANKNGAAARNTGIRHAKGDFIAFLDDDDCFFSQKIERQVQYLHAHKQYAGCYCFEQRKGRTINSIPYKGNVAKELLRLKSHMPTSLLIFRKEVLLALKGFDETYRRHQDYEFLLRYFKAGYLIGCVEEVLSERGTGAANNMPSPDRFLELKNNFLNCFSEDIAYYDAQAPGFKRKTYAIHYGSVFLAFLLEHRLGDALKFTSKYFFYSPTNYTYFFRKRCLSFVTRRILRIIGK